MKKSLLSIIPLILIASSCTNGVSSLNEPSASIENSVLSEPSSYSGPTATFSETVKTYFGDSFEIEEIRYYRYYGQGYGDGYGKVAEERKYSQIVDKLDEVQFRPLGEKESPVAPESFRIRVTGHIEAKQAGLIFNCGAPFTTLRCIQYVDTDVDFALISYTSEDYFSSAQELFNKLFPN